MVRVWNSDIDLAWRLHVLAGRYEGVRACKNRANDIELARLISVPSFDVPTKYLAWVLIPKTSALRHSDMSLVVTWCVNITTSDIRST